MSGKAGNMRQSNIRIRKEGTIRNYPQKTEAYFPQPYQPPPILSYKHTNNNISSNFNIAFYYLHHLLSTDVQTWNTAGGTITQTIKYIGLNKHQIRTV